VGLWLLCASVLVNAQDVELREALAVSSAPDALVDAPGRDDEWTWLTLRDPEELRAMPAGWQLLIDQVRFQHIAVVATSADGSVERQILSADELGKNWAPGGLLRFDLAMPGDAVRELAIGF